LDSCNADDRRMSEQRRVQKWASDLLFSAMLGACAGLLINLLGSWLLPESWWPQRPGWWAMAGIGAASAMLAYCFGFGRRRQPEKSN
jgi:hypothetical protein